MVVPRPLQRQQGRTDTIINPVMIAEVLLEIRFADLYENIEFEL